MNDLPESRAVRYPPDLKRLVIRKLKKIAKKYEEKNNKPPLLIIRIISQWPDIASKSFMHTSPEKIKYTKQDGKTVATLYLRTYEKDKSSLANQLDEVRRKINLYFGRTFIHKIKISENFLDDKKLKEMVAKRAKIKRQAQKTITIK